MNSIPAPSSDPGGSPANVATWWKDTLGIAANLVAIAAAASPLLPLIQASPYYVIAVSVVAATGGSYSLIWLMGREPKSNTLFHDLLRLISVFVIILALVFVMISTRLFQETDLPTYYIKVYVYTFDRIEEVGNADVPAPPVTIEARDKFGRLLIHHKTNQNEPQTMELSTYGPINIGVCGVFETYTVSNQNNSRDNAPTVRIVIDQTRLSSCSE